MVTTQRLEPVDFAHDRGPLRAMRRDALAMQAIGDEMTHFMRDGVEQEVFGVSIQQAAVDANRVSGRVGDGRRHPAQVENELGALETTLKMNFGATQAGIDRGAHAILQ